MLFITKHDIPKGGVKSPISAPTTVTIPNQTRSIPKDVVLHQFLSKSLSQFYSVHDIPNQANSQAIFMLHREDVSNKYSIENT